MSSDTGLSDLMPNQQVTAAVTPPALPEGCDLHQVAEVVRDIAVNFLDEDELLKKHNLTKAQFTRLKTSPYFTQALEVAVADWAKPSSTDQRIAITSALALELCLPIVAARIHAKNEPLSGIVEAMKFLAKCAGIGEPEGKGRGATTEKYIIHIDLGADATLHVEKSRPILDLTAEGNHVEAANTDLGP